MEELDETATLTLISQIVSGVTRARRTDNEGLDVVLSEINRITSRWEQANTPATGTSKVMFALNPETTGWAAAGVDPVEAKTWELIDFTPEYTQRWIEANLTITHAMKWATTYAFKNLDPQDIAAWEHSGYGGDASATYMWLRLPVPTARAIEWVSLGGNFYNGKEWLCAYTDIGVPELYATAELQLGVTKARAWITRGIFGEDIKAFLDKGYTPAAARKHLDGGGTVESAPDKRGGAPVPGRSWKTIAAVIQKNSNLTFKVTEGDVFYDCKIIHKNYDEPVEVKFHKNGQFAESWAYLERHQRFGNGHTHMWRSRQSYNLSGLVKFLTDWK